MLTVSFVFEVLETSEDCYWRSVNLREASVANFEAFARSTVQRVFELVAFKTRKETVLSQKVSAKILGDLWRSNVIQTGSACSESVTDSFVDTAINVYERALALPDVRSVILMLEEKHGKSSPFNSLSVLEKFAIKCKTPEMLLWCVASLADAIEQKFLATNDFSLRAVSGTRGSGKASKGVIDLFIMKKELLDWIKGKFVPAHPFHESVVTALASFKSHQDFRKLCGGPTQQVDNAWMGTMSESGRKIFALLKAPAPLLTDPVDMLLRHHFSVCDQSDGPA